MAYSTQAIKYGWTALIGIVLTGTTIYVASNSRKHVYPRDVIQIPLGIHERCLAAGIATPDFTKTWTSNVYTSSGVTTYTQALTNVIGNYIDREMLVSLDATLSNLVPYFIDTNTFAALTVTGLWASLGIGDGTNQFTRTPAIGTNPATYGDYPQQIYVADLQERYKVLNALRYTLIGQPSSVNGSRGLKEVFGSGGAVKDITVLYYSNTTTGAIVPGYSPNAEALVLGLTPDYTLAIDTNYVWLNMAAELNELAWGQAKQIEEAFWYFGVTNAPLFYPIYSDYVAVATNLNGLDVGSFVEAHKYPDAYLVADPSVIWWDWGTYAKKQYATWRWDDTQIEGLTNIIAVFVKPRACESGFAFATQVVTNVIFWGDPRSWVTNIIGEFEEMTGMTENIYYQIDNNFIVHGSNYWEIEFGSDELSALRLANTFPLNWCDEPNDSGNVSNNVGTVGYVKGCWLPRSTTYGLKDWQFTFCTNKYW